MPTTYNHCDPPEMLLNLPAEQVDLSSEQLHVPNCIEKHVSIPTANGQKITLTLRTDSEHLAKFFSMNWPAHVSSDKSDAVIYALKGSAESYQLSPAFNGPRWFCPKTKQVWVFGNEYYGNLKVTVRGLCSELASDEQMFLLNKLLKLSAFDTTSYKYERSKVIPSFFASCEHVANTFRGHPALYLC